FGTPEHRCGPVGIAQSERLGARGESSREPEIGDHVRIDDDQGRPALFDARNRVSLSRPRTLARSSRAAASSSSLSIRWGCAAALKHSSSSLFKLRRFRCARSLSRRWSSAGTFLTVNVGTFGTGLWYQNGTIADPMVAALSDPRMSSRRTKKPSLED